MLVKPSTCLGCPLQDKGQGFCPDRHSPSPKILLVGEAPGKSEIEKGEPFVGKSGYVLENWLLRAVPLLQIAKEKGHISYMNTLRCLPPEVQGRAYPKGEEKRLAEAHCRQYDQIAPTVEVVILFGESPQRCFFAQELDAEDATDRRLGHDLKGVMGRVGRVYERDGKRWVFAPHPAYILRQPALVTHGQRALEIATGVDAVLEPEYVDWTLAMREILAN